MTNFYDTFHEDFDPENYPNRVCCGMLDWLVEQGYKEPFGIAVGTDDKMQLVSMGWAVSLFGTTRTGNVDNRTRFRVIFPFCPFCGKKIGKDATT